MKGSGGFYYGHSAVGEMKTRYQREDAHLRAINQAIRQYRNERGMGYDSEINYHERASGILYVHDGERKYYKNRITPQRKRQLHREIFLGSNKPTTLSDIRFLESEEVDRRTYYGNRKNKHTAKRRQVSENIVINTGNIHRKARKRP